MRVAEVDENGSNLSVLASIVVLFSVVRGRGCLCTKGMYYLLNVERTLKQLAFFDDIAEQSCVELRDYIKRSSQLMVVQELATV
jgi:hypothetical protein